MENKVLDALKESGEPMKSGEIAKLIGEDAKEVSKIINNLKKEGKIVSPKRCYYSIS
jgi:predicted transcriptional regulator